jgi:hypothetical protein
LINSFNLEAPKNLKIAYGAEFSPCRTWRYSLTRLWTQDKPYALFIGLNPSTATETVDDPTIRRCIGFAKSWGYGGMVMGNLFAFRATNPRDMMAAEDPIGPENDAWLKELAAKAGIIIGAWGIHGAFLDRDKQVLESMPILRCLGITKAGLPRHPLYIRRDCVPVPFDKAPQKLRSN